MADNKMDIDNNNSGVANSGNSNTINQTNVNVNNDSYNNIFSIVIVAIVAIVALVLVFQNQQKSVSQPTPTIKPVTTVDGIMYQNQLFLKEYKWEEAKRYCKDLILENYDNWRLPTRAELHKLATTEFFEGSGQDEYNSWYKTNGYQHKKNSKGDMHFINSEFIDNMPKYSGFWTSETKDNNSAWVVYFNYGHDYWYDKSNNRYALCVR